MNGPRSPIVPECAGGSASVPATLFEKVWDRHVVAANESATLLYIDRHLVHEVTSPQAFDGLRLAGRKVRRPELTFATVDHNVPTENQLDIREPMSRRQVETLRKNCQEFGVPLYDVKSGRQGIVHVIGPELGLTLPGTTIVCGDSHTSTHGAFGSARLRHRHERRSASTSWPRRPSGRASARRRTGSRSRASSTRASKPRTSSSRSSAPSARAEPRGTSSNTTVRPSAPSRWRAG